MVATGMMGKLTVKFITDNSKMPGSIENLSQHM